MQQPFVSSSSTSLNWINSWAWEISIDYFKNIKSVPLEATKKVESQCVRDVKGRLLRDKGRIHQRWVRFFRSLLNAKSDKLDSDIPKGYRSNQSRAPSGSSPRKRRLP